MHDKHYLPPIGHRIIKTAAAVFVCLLIHMLSGYHGSPSQAAVAAIICMQPYADDSKSYAFDRVFGTILGSAWGFAYLLLMSFVPLLSHSMALAYLIMSLFVLLSIYSTVVIKKPTIASLVAIAFLCMVENFPEVDITFLEAFGRLIYTVIGTAVAVIVNVSHLPRKKHTEKLFFVRTMDLTPDRYAKIPSSVHITLDRLFGDGAKICLVSRWAPAFVISQMGLLDISIPMIVMDGSAMYDPQNNGYLEVSEIPKENADRLAGIIRGFDSFCSIYTVHDNSLCIYRCGSPNEAECREYEIMKRSPYRNYMEGSYRDEDKIAFMRVIDTPERIEALAYLVQSVLPPGMFRMELREEAQFPDFRGLYFYDADATVAAMKERVLAHMEEKCGEKLEPKDILPKLSKYSPEHDAMLLLGRLKASYEPVDLFAPFRSKNEKSASQ